MLQALYHTCLFYGTVLVSPYSPGTLAWKLYKNRKGIIPFIHRDLICDVETLKALPKSEGSLDEFTTAFSPFVPLLTLNGSSWQMRRKVLVTGLRKIQLEPSFDISLPLKKGDIYEDVFEILFRQGFKMIFGREVTSIELNEMYPGIVDINRLIKRQVSFPNQNLRWKLYHRTVLLISEENPSFIFSDSEEFKKMSEIDQVSLIVEDLLTSICIQCTDLICHLLLLSSKFPEAFKNNIDLCISETLRLYPLTDIWTRKATDSKRGWIASLVQLNRNGWSDPDCFKPERWESHTHPDLISWGFDLRGCPATKIGYNLSKTLFQKLISNPNRWVLPASNYTHDRTFSLGCQVWVGEGQKPSTSWKFQGKGKTQLKLFLASRLRVLDQRELW